MIRKTSKSAIMAAIAMCAALQPFGLQPSIAASPRAGRAVWNRPADLEAIRSIENRMADTANVDGLGNIVSDQAVLVDAYVPAVSRGRAAILEAYRKYRETLAGSKGRFTEMSVISTPGFACSASQIRFDVPAPGHGTTPAEYRKLDVFKKIGGRWQLIQQHISQAIDRKTGMVAAGPLPVRGPLAWNAASLSRKAIDPEAARQGIVDWTDSALREVGLESAMKFFAPGHDVLLYGEFNPGNIRTRAEVTGYYGPLYNSFSGLHVVNPLYEADSDGLLGAQIDTQDIVIDMNDGSRPRLSIRQSDCLRQYDGKWQTFMEMVSYPVDRATGKAMMLSPDFKTR
ncbi:YybH family protein [Novosphingobium lentum]|uniref:YybH family protein n=1 Tax=Novosphingobium lentum TaxID=145287 RepID=UPI00082BA1E2|nr:nuclear transport factor 2 family protein [Novosphingobium lentum]